MALGRKPIEIVNEGKHQLLAKAVHWERIYLREVAKVQNGYAFSSTNFSKEEGLPLIRIRDIDSETTVDKYKGDFPKEYLVNKGDILVGMDGDFKAAKWKGEKALLNQRVCRIFPSAKNFDDKFLFLCLQPFLDAIHEETSAVTVKHLSSRTIEEIPLPYPPLEEQQQIVSKIEELFSELDKGIEELKTAQQQLKVYRQAVLKWAFEGRLTDDWRKENPVGNGAGTLIAIKNKRNELLRNPISNSSQEAGRVLNKIRKHKFTVPEQTTIPNDWCWTSFLDACYLVVDCHNKTAPYQEDGIFLIRTSNIKNGKLLLDEKIKFVSEATYEYWSRRCPPQPGDILFTREAPMGEAAIIPNNTKVCMGQRIMLLRTFPEMLSTKYLHYAMMESGFLQRMNNNAIGTGVKHLRVGDVEELVFPICSPEEQQQIVQEIESRLSVCDKIEETITESLKQAEALRQSILKKAFEGKLK